MYHDYHILGEGYNEYLGLDEYDPYDPFETMTRSECDALLCYDEETKEFDWDEYQHLCDIADYWNCED
jgi:hypothetical protein